MKQFERGDRVVCINDNRLLSYGLDTKEVYVVGDSTVNGLIFLNDKRGSWNPDLFEFANFDVGL